MTKVIIYITLYQFIVVVYFTNRNIIEIFFDIHSKSDIGKSQMTTLQKILL